MCNAKFRHSQSQRLLFCPGIRFIAALDEEAGATSSHFSFSCSFHQCKASLNQWKAFFQDRFEVVMTTPVQEVAYFDDL